MTFSSVNPIWVLLGAALVFFMQAGFALLESGSVRAKNAVNVMMKNYTDMCIGGLAFYLVGFGLMMGTNHSGFVGTDHFMPVNLSNMDWALMFFQMMFAATAVTIASGAMAERVSFIGYAVAACLICLFIYPVFACFFKVESEALLLEAFDLLQIIFFSFFRLIWYCRFR